MLYEQEGSVDAMRLGKMRSASKGWRLRTAQLSRVVGVVAALLVALAALPAGASAEPLCTDKWTGPSEGPWRTASDWSTGKVPSSSDVACIGSGKTVSVTEGNNQVGVVEGEGTLVISNGTLEVLNTLEPSIIHSLSLKSTLTGAATVEVSGSLTTNFGAMVGTGSTVVLPGATATFEDTYLEENRTLINEGTATYTKGDFTLSEQAVLKNKGTFKANAESTPPEFRTRTGTPSIVNTGLFEKTEGTGRIEIEASFENLGTIKGGSAAVEFVKGANVALGSSVLEGKILDFGSMTAGNLKASSATLELAGTLSVTGGSTAAIGTLEEINAGGILTGAGTVDVSGSLITNYGSMIGSGSTVILPGATATFGDTYLEESRTLVNEGVATYSKGDFTFAENAILENIGTFKANAESTPPDFRTRNGSPVIVNNGLFEKTEGTGKTYIETRFENNGILKELSGEFYFTKPEYIETSVVWGGEENPQEPALCGDAGSVGCQTGNYAQTQTDFSIGGRGIGLGLSRTYNSQAAVAGDKGVFGYGWSSSFSDHLTVEKASKKATLVQADGNTITFVQGSGEEFTAPAWTQDTLSGTENTGYTLTLPNQTKYKFTGSGRLESVTDRNGNATTLSYNGSGNLETITDPAGRKIKLAYNSEGLVEGIEDPLKHVVKYTYESGNLATVTQPGESALRWQFKYDSSHRMTELVDGRSGKSTIEYNGSNQVVSQTDPLKRTTSLEYTAFHTTTTNHATGDVIVQYFTSKGMGTSVTNGYGTSSATTETRTFNAANELLSVTDGDGHTTKYGYDTHANRTSMVNPDNDETKWEYNSTHDVISTTTPNGEKTTIKRDSHGNPEVIERPAPGGKTQITKYKYGSHGEAESMTDPLEHTWKYEYDSYGDRTAEIDPEGNKRTWEYNEDSQETTMVSPRGHVKAGEEEKYRTKTERDAQGRPIKITDPLGHVTEYKYDGDGNIEKITDANKHTTTYTYDNDNERTKVEAPNKAITELEYDGAGRVIAEIDGNKHKTKSKRNVIEEVIEVTDPLGHVTTKEYDGAGNLVKLTDPAKRTTTNTYDPANRLTEVSYSSGKPSTVKYEYDKDGNRTKMVDGTGTTTYAYDQLDRMTESENGHKETVKYEYDLANDQVKITYPGGKEVTQAFDKDSRIEKVTDWLKHETKFTYDPDSDLKATTFPSETKNEDKYSYNNADQMSEVKILKGTETLASLAYTRDNDGQVKKTTAKGLPGAEVTEATYDENNRLTKYGSAEYKYDAANNPTKEASSENTYNEGNELEKGTGVTYSYDELDERTKKTPSTGPATSYGYDQAGKLTSVERPKEGETAEIKDSYEYNGEGLRTSQTINGKTGYLAWGGSTELPVILSDGTNSYIYGPKGLPIEQINAEGKTQYLHHDQQGSTRLITGSTGTVEGKCTYGAYGIPTCEGTATTPLGYSGQYTDADTGLIYLRARYYDPATAQFMTVDPRVEDTQEAYTYAASNPLSLGDPSGMAPIGCHMTHTPCAEQEERRFRENLKHAQHEHVSAEIEAALSTILKYFNIPSPEPGVEYEIQPAKNGNGIILRKPGTTGDANTIRIMFGDKANPHGSAVIYDGDGNPVDYKSGSVPKTRGDYHIPGGNKEPVKGIPEWWSGE